MPVEEFQSYTYFSVSRNGTIRQTSAGENKDEEFRSIYGILTGINLVEDKYEGEVEYKYHFKFETPSHDSVEILQMGEASSAARGLILSLFSKPGDIYQVRIAPYQKATDGSDKKFTNLWVEFRDSDNGEWEKVDWDQEALDNMPESKEVQVGRKTMYDDSERRMYIRKLAVNVKKNKLNNVGTTAGAGKDALESEEGPERVKQQPKDIETNTNLEIDDSFDDMDDDLPF